MTELERYFERFRAQIIGIDQKFSTPHGERPIVYADWTASGRLYSPIEATMIRGVGPFVGNTHTEASVTGTRMTQAYRQAREIIKRHVNAGPDDVILTTGTGMTGAVAKLQRILGLKIPEQVSRFVKLGEAERPVVILTHMEHHSNHTSWLETVADVVCVDPSPRGTVDTDSLRRLVRRYAHRPLKIGAFTACSNVTGIQPPIHTLAGIMHEHGGYCFADYAASAPYVEIDMHPENSLGRLDAVFFSPHKFLGGPGAAGVLIFKSQLYDLEVPDQPGGGTVDWTNPWGGRRYVDGIEAREDGGTPGFLQAIRAALCIRLKEEMGVEQMHARERELRQRAFTGLRRIPHLQILADHIEERLPIISFYIGGLHYNLIVRLLNDRFGIQTRGGCSCAGTYGHYLLHLDPIRSQRITHSIDRGDRSEKPGWVRVSLHPTTTDDELDYIIDALAQIQRQREVWIQDYRYDSAVNDFLPTVADASGEAAVSAWFDGP